ncbi:membrane protein insertion efficiency factor YidD [Pelagibacterales bacterium SAG-MED20]|nr:membrane protein insertion efficiency factor YidD [Pelagibacterales bacterium SAG-MED20]
MKIIANILISLIKFYKMVISPYMAPSCRYSPTCSDYTIDCLKTYGLIKGIFKATKRILSCHPFSKRDSFDPVVKELKVKR